VTGLARAGHRERQRHLDAGDRLVEVEADLGLEVAPAIGARAPAPAAAGRSAGPAAAEQVREDVAERRGVEVRPRAARTPGTARGAASLLIQAGSHPEKEVDKVTTPQGCTIAGLNQMEHNGFSSALIKGIVSSADKAAVLYAPKPRS